MDVRVGATDAVRVDLRRQLSAALVARRTVPVPVELSDARRAYLFRVLAQLQS